MALVAVLVAHTRPANNNNNIGNFAMHADFVLTAVSRTCCCSLFYQSMDLSDQQKRKKGMEPSHFCPAKITRCVFLLSLKKNPEEQKL